MKKIINLLIKIIIYRIAAKFKHRHILTLRLDMMSKKEIEQVLDYLNSIALPSIAINPETKTDEEAFRNAQWNLFYTIDQLKTYMEFKHVSPFTSWWNSKTRILYRIFF